MYLSFTLSWLAAAVALLVWHWLDPDATHGKIGGFSLGWVALLMGLWTLARWWNLRSYQALRQAEREAHERRRRRTREQAETDPNSPFNFGEPPETGTR